MSDISNSDANVNLNLNLKPGDVIAYKRMFFTHYGLYIGDDMIIHRDKTGGKPSVAISRLRDVPGRISVANHQYSGMKRVNTRDAIARAMQHVGDTKYNVITDNCEHFVTENRYNKRVSIQVARLRDFFVAGVSSFLLASIICS